MPEKKRVCILLQNNYDYDNRVRRKAEALVLAGYEVDVFALPSASSPSRDYYLNSVHVRTFDLKKKRGSKGRYYFEYFTFFIWAWARLSLRNRRNEYDIIDVNTLPDFLLFAASIHKRRGTPLVLDMHEIFPEFLISKYGCEEDHWQVKFARFLERVSFNYADHVIVINEPIQRLLESRGLAPHKSTIIMNSVDETLFAAPHEADEKIGLISGQNRFVMMYHGTLARIYGLDIAIEAFSRVQDKMPDAVFWIIGEGPEKENLKRLSLKLKLDSKVMFVDLVLPERIPQYIRRCSIGIVPTRQDVFLDLSFSNKLSEYIISGKPIVTSRLKTIRHYFSEDALTFFEPNSPADLAKQMVYAYQNREIREERAARAQKEYEPLNWGIMKERYLNLIEKLSGPSRKN